MVPGPIANAILQSATIQLQKSNVLLSGRTLVMDKFGEELLRQMSHVASSQNQSLTSALSGTRPITFLPVSSDAGMASCQKSSTSKRSDKKKRDSSASHSGPIGVASKR